MTWPVPSFALGPIAGSGWTVAGVWRAYQGVSLDWSPDGRHLLAYFPGEGGWVSVIDADGVLAAEFSAYSWAGWVDDARVMLLRRDSGSFEPRPPNEAWLAALDGSAPVPVPVPRGWPLASEHGRIAFVETFFREGDDCAFGCPVQRYAVWSEDTTSDVRPGGPVAWSPDGSRLFVLHDRKETEALPRGAPAAERLRGWLEVLGGPLLEPIRRFPDVIVTDNAVHADPTGRYLGFGDLERSDRLRIVDTVEGTVSSFGTYWDFAWDEHGHVVQIPGWSEPIIAFNRAGEVVDRQPLPGQFRLTGAGDGTAIIVLDESGDPDGLVMKRYVGHQLMDIEQLPGSASLPDQPETGGYCGEASVAPGGSNVAVSCTFVSDPYVDEPRIQVVFVHPL